MANTFAIGSSLDLNALPKSTASKGSVAYAELHQVLDRLEANGTATPIACQDEKAMKTLFNHIGAYSRKQKLSLGKSQDKETLTIYVWKK